MFIFLASSQADDSVFANLPFGVVSKTCPISSRSGGAGCDGPLCWLEMCLCVQSGVHSLTMLFQGRQSNGVVQDVGSLGVIRPALHCVADLSHCVVLVQVAALVQYGDSPSVRILGAEKRCGGNNLGRIVFMREVEAMHHWLCGRGRVLSKLCAILLGIEDHQAAADRVRQWWTQQTLKTNK